MRTPTCRLAAHSPFDLPRAAALAALTAALLYMAAALPAGAAMTAVGDPAGDFRLRDAQGREVQLRQVLDERAALVVFSSVGCIPCEESGPPLRQLAARFPGRLEVLWVMLSEPGTVRHWLDAGGGDPGGRTLVGIDGSPPYDTARRYGVLGTPTAFLVGRDGTVRWRHVGRITADQTEEVLPALVVAAGEAEGPLLARRAAP